MPEKLLLINPAKPPSKRRQKNPRKKTVSKKATSTRNKPMAKQRRTAAQRRATAKLVAFNKARARKPVRRSNPAKRKAPVRRKTRTYKGYPKTVTFRKPNPIRRRRRNPVKQKGIVDAYLIPALQGSAGAVGVDVIWSYLPIPDTIKVGPMRHPAKLGIALGAALLAEKVVSKPTAEALGVGAMTVIGHNALREMVGTYIPGLKMDGVGYMSPALVAGQENMGYYPTGMGYYPQSNEAAYVPSENESNYNYG